ncbi:MAG: hypothetical protein IT375_20300 [Polyangiaceae bacterium]|nr:hypothetical protein [Polyangiaceae bacterium]
MSGAAIDDDAAIRDAAVLVARRVLEEHGDLSVGVVLVADIHDPLGSEVAKAMHRARGLTDEQAEEALRQGVSAAKDGRSYQIKWWRAEDLLAPFAEGGILDEHSRRWLIGKPPASLVRVVTVAGGTVSLDTVAIAFAGSA